ncbi:hypothetical protein DL89DRAFT_265425, partial [Linderina pennispora]
MNPQLSFIYFSLLFLTSNALNYPLVRRETSVARVREFHGAVLLKNGKQTSCELALMHNKAAFVPASCFDIDSSNNVNDVSPYEVALDAGGTPITRETVTVDKVIINPRYNPTTYANNVAVIFFNSQAKEEWSNYIDRYPQELTDRAYVRRSMNDEEKKSWNAPAVVNDVKNDEGCKQASAQFASNPADLWCSPMSVTSPVGGSCHVPYGIVYGIVGSDMVVTAMYSHSAVYGNDMCGDSKAYHYYTVLSNYLNWAVSVVPGGFAIFSSDGQYSASDDPNYGIQDSNGSSPNGVNVVGGDLYARIPKADSKATSSLPSTSTSTSTEPSSASSTSSHDSSHSLSVASSDSDESSEEDSLSHKTSTSNSSTGSASSTYFSTQPTESSNSTPTSGMLESKSPSNLSK